MKNFSFKSSGLIKNDSPEMATLCDWLRNIHQQNMQVLNLLRMVNRKIDEPVTDSVLEGPPEE